MTHTVHPDQYKTKKAFREAVERDPDKVRVADPSIFNPFGGTVTAVVEEMERRGTTFTVTNHPKRSWFAAVKRKNGKIVVE